MTVTSRLPSVRSGAELPKSAATVVWVLLIPATVLSWALGTRHGILDDSAAVRLIILAIAFIKIRYIGLYFMDLKAAPLALRALLEAWCLGVCVITSVFVIG